MKLSIIIPVYKGEDTLIPLFTKIKETLEGEYDYEVIFISDKAIDNSWSKIQYLYSCNSTKIRGYKLKYNYGQHKAILFGVKVATGNYLITLDEDMQHDPAFIPIMLKYLVDNKLDVVYGKFVKFQKNNSRKFGSKLGRKIATLFIPQLYKDYSPFRIIRTEVIESFNAEKDVVFIDALLGNATSIIGVYPITHLENKRPSSYSIGGLGVLAASIILWYSRKARYMLLFIVLTLILSMLWPVSQYSEKSLTSIVLSSTVILVIIISLFIFIAVRIKCKRTLKVVEIVGPIN
jgi:polyisoprenyl-phosphate glycosyltransferase